MSRQEINGVSGWNLLWPLMAGIPDDLMKEAQKCESPIEQLFVSALALAIQAIALPFRPKLSTQVQIGRYRADIVLTGPNGAPRIVVECDGAEFHKDVKRDVKRTEAIEKLGYRVVRLTGSEIYNNPLARARSLLWQAGLVAPTAAQAEAYRAEHDPEPINITMAG